MTIIKLNENEVFSQTINDEELQNITGGRVDVRTDDTYESARWCTGTNNIPPNLIVARDLIK